jgi:hypothetical protein
MTKKKAVKRVAKKKDPKKSKAAIAKAKNDANKKKAKAKAGEKKPKPGSMIRDLLLEQKYTDEEIFAKVDKAFPGKTKQTYCNNWRHWINKLSGMKSTEKNPIERLYKIDGKLVKKSAMPKPERKAKKKYTEENDPLKKVAGINVHGKKKTASKKTAVKKTAKKRALKKS